MIIGVTGRVGSGKSWVINYLMTVFKLDIMDYFTIIMLISSIIAFTLI